MESYNNFIRNLKAKIEYKRIENRQYGKTYAINEIDKTVIKCKLCDSKLEIKIVKYLCDYYKSKLNLNFNVYYNEKTHELKTISPFLNVLDENSNISDKLIYNKTNMLLQNFVKNTNLMKYCIPNTHINCYCETCNPENYFMIGNDIYLLDMEEFYLCVFDKDNTSLGLKGIKSIYREMFKPFVLNEDPDELIYNPNPIFY